MAEIQLHNDDWDLSCSDDELSKQGTIIGKSWVIEANELEELYNNIDKNGIIMLHWECPGRREITAVQVTKTEKVEVCTSPIKEKSDFDFMDEVSSPKLRVRREGENTLRGSAKKKTTSFDGILSNMIRHKRIEEMEKQAHTPTSASNS